MWRWPCRKIRSRAAALVLLTFGAGSASPSEPKIEYTPLDGLLVSQHVTAVREGAAETQLWGETVTATRYALTAPVDVQIECNGTSSGTYEQQVARYELRVVADPDLRLRKQFLREIYDYWKAQPADALASSESFSADMGVVEKNGRYLLYSKPDHQREGATYRFHANQRLFEIELKSVEGGGWGPLSSLIAEHLAFLEGGETIDQVYFEPKFPLRTLLALYEANALR